ncbi:glucuronate isomerase [Aggregatilinea lenta]|uniref:glucuronate isomerase n=1 Tax=Aggregatilinea lenta TaxID=913108 RepID=UPI000E5BC13E|nr:glucuronate isomerase [Aggregatilinea lenta]
MTAASQDYLPDDRYFGPDARQKDIALGLYTQVRDLPLICPHGHVEPRLFSDPDASFGSPSEFFIIPDHYVFRMLYSRGVSLEALGVPRIDGGPTEQDHRKIWQIFAEHFYLFRGTPTSQWLKQEFHDLFGINEPLTGDNAQAIYDQIDARLKSPEFSPRPLFEQFNIEILCTTDAATDTLEHHRALRDSGWRGDIRPTFRPDAVVNLGSPGWRAQIDLLSNVSSIAVTDYAHFIQALEQRRAFFKDMGAQATDHAAQTAQTARLSDREADAIFQRALRGEDTDEDAARFTAHMLMEMARMSAEDGLVMQIHIGSLRDHNRDVAARFGRDKGADIPLHTTFTRELQPLLNTYGTDPRFRLVIFTLDESTYSRELAPLAGHYPALRIGPPWWFFDSLNGMEYYFERIVETAGLYNTAGFNDDTRAFPSIPARHDLWRRASVNWIAGLVARGIVTRADAEAMAHATAYGLAKATYRFANSE